MRSSASTAAGSAPPIRAARVWRWARTAASPTSSVPAPCPTGPPNNHLLAAAEHGAAPRGETDANAGTFPKPKHQKPDTHTKKKRHTKPKTQERRQQKGAELG